MTEESEELENFFINEGQWLENQIKAEDYEACPACSQMVEFLKHLHKQIQGVLEEVDRLNDDEETSTMAEWFMTYNKSWYMLCKDNLLSLLQAAHRPDKIMKAHPELAISKMQKRKIRSRKNLRKHAKKRVKK